MKKKNQPRRISEAGYALGQGYVNDIRNLQLAAESLKKKGITPSEDFYTRLKEAYEPDEGDGFFSTVWDAITHPIDTASDVLNTARMWTGRYIDSWKDSIVSNVDDISLEIKNANYLKQYAELVELRQDLLRQYNELGRKDPDNNPYIANLMVRISESMLKIQEEIQQYDEYFTGEGRNSEIVRKTLYDDKYLGFDDSLSLRLKYLMQGQSGETSAFSFKGMWDTVTGAFSKDNPSSIPNNIASNVIAGIIGTPGSIALPYATDWASRALNDITMPVVNFMGLASDSLGEIFGDKNRILGQMLSQLDPNDDIIKNSYIPYHQYDFNHNYSKTVDEKIEDYKRQQEELKARYNSLQRFSRDGNISQLLANTNLIPFIPGTSLTEDELRKEGFDIDIYDPEDVPLQFKDALQYYASQPGAAITHPLYSFVETASSFSMMHYQLGQIGLDGMLSYIGKKLPTWAMKSNAVSAMLTAASVGGNLWATTKSREDETAQEKIEALGERVLEQAMKNGANPEVVFKDIKEGLIQKGVDIDGVPEQDIMKLGVAFDIKSEDEGYNKALHDVRKGINKLVNANNSLAFMDYVDMLPFLSYSGSALKRYARRTYGDAVSDLYTRNYIRTQSLRYSDVGLKPGSEVLEQQRRFGKFADYDRTLRSAYDATIDGAAKKLLTKDMPKLALYGRTIASAAGKLAAGQAWHAGLESIEEGQQHLLQQRYKRGEYDDYNTPVSVLNVHEIFDNIKLGQESISDYLGLRSWDPDNESEQLRAAMNIGFSAALQTGGLLAAVKQIADPNSEAREFIQRLKDDKQTIRFLGKQFENKLDYDRLRFFYDAFNGGGATKSHMLDNLQFIKDGVDENSTLVKKEDVEHDIRLMNALWRINTNDEFNKQFAGIDSKNRKEAVVLGARRVVDQMNTEDRIADNERFIDNAVNDVVDFISDMFDPEISDERKQQLKESDRQLAESIESIRQFYGDYLSGRQKQLDKEFNNWSANVTQQIFEDDEAVKQYANENGFTTEQLWANETRRRKALKVMHRAQSKQTWLSQFQFTPAEESASETEKRVAIQAETKAALAFFNNRYIIKAIEAIRPKNTSYKKFLHNVWNSPELKQEVIDKAFEIRRDNTYTEEDFVQHLAKQLFTYLRLKAIKKAYDVTSNQVEFLRYIRKELGYDINPEKLAGTQKYLKTLLDEEVEKEEAALNGPKESRDPNTPLAHYSDVFEKYDMHLAGEKEIMQTYVALAISHAMKRAQQPMVDAYTLGHANPVAAVEAMFGETGETDQKLQEIANQYKQKSDDFHSKSKMEMHPGERLAVAAELESLEAKAAQQIIAMDIRDREERKWIARKHNMEDGTISEKAVEQINEEEAAKEQKEQQDLTQQKSTKPKDVVLSNESEAERKLKQLFTGARATTPEERAKARREREERRKNKKQKDNKQEQPTKTDTKTLQDFDKVMYGTDKLDVPSVATNDPTGWATTNWVETVAKAEDGQIVARIEDLNSENPRFLRVIKTTEKSSEGDTKLHVAIQEILINEDDEISITDVTLYRFPENTKLDSKYEEHDDNNKLSSGEAEIYTDKEGTVKIVDLEGRHFVANEEQKETHVDDEAPSIDDSAPVEIEAPELTSTLPYIDEGEEVRQPGLEEDGNLILELPDLLLEEEDMSIDDDRTRVDDYVDLGWDGEDLLDEDGNKIPKSDQKGMKEELLLMEAADSYSFDQTELPEREENDPISVSLDQRKADATYETLVRLYSRTFFFRPDAETPINLVIGDKKVNLRKPLGTGKELAKKLIQKGWLDTTTVYYIVTQPEQNTKIAEGSYIRDSMTVSMVIEDKDKCYVCTLRALGTIEKEDGSTGKSYEIHSEVKLRSKLRLRGVDWAKVSEFLHPGEGSQWATPDNPKVAADLYAKAEEAFAKDRAYHWYVAKYGEDLAKRKFEKIWKYDPNANGYKMSVLSGREEYQKDLEDRKYVRSEFFKIARLYFAKPGKSIASYEAIEEEINRLREFRNKIIDAYLGEPVDGKYTFPEKVKTNVRPVGGKAQQSNGKITKTPEYRNLLTNDPSIEEVQKKIGSSELMFGFGRGKYGRNPYQISPLLEGQSEAKANKGGLSGKIYMMVKAIATNARERFVPVMLMEQRFDVLHRVVDGKQQNVYLSDPENLRECLQLGVDGTIEMRKDANGYLPSAAEVIFYMLAGKYDFGTTDPQAQQEIIEFFIHNGEKTLLKNKIDDIANSPLNELAAKQLSIDVSENGKPIIKIAIKNDRGGYELLYFTDEMLFPKSADNIENVRTCESNRRAVILAIANQMHWNTDRTHMNSQIVPASNINAMSQFIGGLFGTVAENDPDKFLQQSVSLFGCPELTFKASDFYKKDGRRGVKAQKVGVTAWMVKNGKLVTNTTEEIFQDPFVFAEGVEDTSTPAEKKVEQLQKESGTKEGQPINVTGEQLESPKKPKPKKKPETNTNVYELGTARFEESVGPKMKFWKNSFGFEVASEESIREQFREKLNQQEGAKKNGGIADRFVITFPSEEDIKDLASLPEKDAKKEVERYIKKKLDELFTHYNKLFGTKYDIKSVIDFDSNLDIILGGVRRKNAVITVDLYKNNKCKVFSDPISKGSNKYTGAFSKDKGTGKLNKENARKWLAEKLGLKDNQIAIFGMARSCENDEVFGVMLVVFDRIYRETVGIIMLDDANGEGIQYHEAWHYVNLLVHDEKERFALYDAFREANKKVRKNKDLTYRDIEELMADDFKKWMEGQMDNSWTGKIKRHFNAIFDMLLASRRKRIYRRVYEKIRDGGYSQHTLNQASVEEFKRAYQNGIAASNYVAGYGQNILAKLPNINSYTEFFETVDAVVKRLYSYLQFDTLDKIKEYSDEDKKFDNIITVVKNMIDSQENETIRKKLQDVLDNPAILKRAFIESFADIGIDVRIKKEKNKPVENTTPEDALTDAEAKENQKDFSWDIFELTVSKRENASLGTKLFLKMIPVYKSVYDGKKYVWEQEDPDIYGNVKYWGFREAWNKIQELWQVESLCDTDENGQYKPTSLYGMLLLRAKSDGFYQAVYDKLMELEFDGEYGDINLKSLIFTTICSYKSPILHTRIQDPQNAMVSDDSDVVLDNMEMDTSQASNIFADAKREWLLVDDENLQAMRAIPRRWSQLLAKRGLIDFDRKTNTSIVSPVYAKVLAEMYTNLLSQVETKTTKAQSESKVSISEKSLKKAILRIHEDLDLLLNFMGIPTDSVVIKNFIASYLKDGKTSALDEIDVIYDLLTNKAIGSIFSFVQQITRSSGKSTLEKQEKRAKFDRELDEVYNNYVEVDKGYTDLTMLVLAYNAVHPSPQDYKMKGPNGEMYYPINENNTLTSNLRHLNDKDQYNPDTKQYESSKVNELRQSSYCQHSKVLDAAELADRENQKSRLKLKTFVGFKDADKTEGSDYFEITPLEDYLNKMFMTEQDIIIFPTMADKKTWYGLQSSNIKLCHDVMISGMPSGNLQDVINEEYQKEHPLEDALAEGKRKSQWESEGKKWFDSLPEDNETKLLLRREAANRYVSEKASKKIGLSIDEFGNISPSFSTSTLNLFCGYFMDELDSVIDYYDKKHVSALVKDAHLRKENFHGQVEDGRMDFSGNGGKFRYFYDVLVEGSGLNLHNINQHLEALYLLQLKIEKGDVKDRSKTKADLQNLIGVSSLRALQAKLKEEGELDGFELVRAYLKDLRSKVKSGVAETAYTDYLRTMMNDKLLRQTYAELDRISDPVSPWYLVKVDEKTGLYQSVAIPNQFLEKYQRAIHKAGLGDKEDEFVKSNAIFSLIANYVVNEAISVIETEKVFTGDPAYYSYRNLEDENREEIKTSVKISYKFEDGSTASETVQVENLDDIYADKIKRLGGFLSPGKEIRLSYSEMELAYDEKLKSSVKNYDEMYIPLKGSKYTNLNVEDVKVSSLFLNQQKKIFKTQLLVDIIRSKGVAAFDKWFEEQAREREKTNEELVKQGKQPHKELTKEKLIQSLYGKSNDLVDKFIATLSKEDRQELEKNLLQQLNPYKNITVCDALVFIRPALYRKIRIGLGEWTFKADKDGYSDEAAYKILESDGDWMSDPEKSKMVRKFLAYVLKMSYSNNESSEIEGIGWNNPLYNKMAIFPIFKFHTSTEVGSMLYKRMNQKDNQIDMISFKSAVKTGAIQKGLSLITAKQDAVKKIRKDKKDKNYKPSEDEIIEAMDVEGSLSKLNEKLQLPSNKHIDYATDGVSTNPTSSETLGITIQDLRNLRMQLNTKAHEAEIRSIGTQMFKIAFENIIDDVEYNGRLGIDIKKDIMKCLNSLTDIGEENIKKEFYTDGKIDTKKVYSFIKEVVESNNLGPAAEEIIHAGGVAASLMSRQVFENAASAKVNRQIVNINTKGGTAIQQSVFGFVGLSNDEIADQSVGNYISYNDGKELLWNTENGSMEVLLSMNFFRSVLPKSMKDSSFEERRQWLIDHDVIKGLKSKKYWKMSKEDAQMIQLLDTKIIDLNFSVRLLKVLQPVGVSTLGDIIDKKDIIIPRLGKKIKTELDDILESLNLSWNSEKPNTNPVYSNPKPYGMGYRIPTQGMSSMFAMTVADVIPELCGDLIVVPREFTALTGSDFDIDKLFISTMSYKNGVLETGNHETFRNGHLTREQAEESIKNKYAAKGISMETIDLKEIDAEIEEEMKKDIAGIICNRLLLNYIDIVTDVKNFSDARGSIDVITKKLKSELLDPILKTRNKEYLVGMTPLLPSFQSQRKMEFSTGKFGIGAFALNITNLALTQAMHLDMDLDSNHARKSYGFGHFDDIIGKDGKLISSWLSAMVNAHVDVAKDPYIFDLNVNSFTYNMCNFLIRTGMGISTFTFLAQPLLKRYASLMVNAGGIYGGNLKGIDPSQKLFENARRDNLRNVVKDAIEKLLTLSPNVNEELKKKINIAIDYYNVNLILWEKDKKDAILSKYGEEGIPRPTTKASVFDENIAKDSILSYKSSDVDKLASSIIYQLGCLLAFNEISVWAQKLNEVVQASQIDTKKFGNNITDHIDFVNGYYQTIYKSDIWTINEAGFDEQFVKKDKDGEPKKDKDGNFEVDTRERSIAALKRYFEKSFLDRKLMKATRYTRQILLSQLFTATQPFADIFKTTCATFSGTVTVKMGKGVYQGYEKLYNNEKIQSISKAIDNVLRYRSIANYGFTTYQLLMKQNNTKAIDFTMGGDRNAVAERLKRIIYGDGNTKSLFDRISILVDDIKRNGTEKPEYFDFVNIEGDLSNELLLYLSPISPTEKYPIGRMMLSTSSIDTDSYTETKLITAFDALLSSDDDNIREIARDLAFYAYYSTYDQNTTNSFFNLVPPQYRKQYDDALGSTLNALNSRKEALKLKALMDICDVQEDGLTYDDIISKGVYNVIDVISRNYWYDDYIVPPVYINVFRELELFGETKSGKIYGDLLFEGNINKSFPKWFGANDIKGNPRYVKIRDGKETALYRRIGVIKRSVLGKSDNGESKEIQHGQPIVIYARCQKAGLHNGKINQYELYVSDETPSIFDTNKLYSTNLSETVVREEVLSYVEREQKEGSEEYICKIEWDSKDIPAMYSEDSSIFSIVYKGKTEYAGTSIISIQKQPETKLLSAADVVINIISGAEHEYTGNVMRYVGKNKETGERQFKLRNENTINVNINESADAIIDKILALQTEGEGMKIHFTSSIYDSKFPVSDKAVERYIQDQIEQYRSEHADEPADDVENYIESLKKDLEKYGPNTIRQMMFNLYLDTFIQTLQDKGVNIRRVSCAETKGHSRLARAIGVLSKQGKLKFEWPNQVYFDKDYLKNRYMFKNAMKLMNVESELEVTLDDEELGINKQAEEQQVSNIILKLLDNEKQENNQEQKEMPQTEQEVKPVVVDEASNDNNNEHEKCSTPPAKKGLGMLNAFSTDEIGD